MKFEVIRSDRKTLAAQIKEGRAPLHTLYLSVT